MIKRILLLTLLLTLPLGAQIVPRYPPTGAALPATCRLGQIFFKTAATVGLYQCTATNTWTTVTAAQLPAATTAALGAVIARDNLAVDASGNLDFSPLDTTVFFLRDDFTVQSKTTNLVGQLAWRYTPTVACTPLNLVSTAPNYGLFQMTTGAAAGDGCAIDLAGIDGLGLLGVVGAQVGVEQHFIFKVAQTASTSLRVGYAISSYGGVVEPTDGVWLRYEKNSSAGGTTQTTVTAAENSARDTATYTTPLAHGYHVGDSAVVTLCTDVNFRLTGNITAVTATSFNVATAVPVANAATNTCTVKVADTTFKFETRKASASDSYDSGAVPNTANFYHLKLRNIVSGKVGLTLYDNVGAVLVAEKTFCAAGCDVTSANVNTTLAMVPMLVVFSSTGGDAAAKAAQVDFYAFKARALTR